MKRSTGVMAILLPQPCTNTAPPDLQGAHIPTALLPYTEPGAPPPFDITADGQLLLQLQTPLGPLWSSFGPWHDLAPALPLLPEALVCTFEKPRQFSAYWYSGTRIDSLELSCHALDKQVWQEYFAALGSPLALYLNEDGVVQATQQGRYLTDACLNYLLHQLDYRQPHQTSTLQSGIL